MELLTINKSKPVPELLQLSAPGFQNLLIPKVIIICRFVVYEVFSLFGSFAIVCF